ncbi:MAG: 4Fe-4S ferredoxin [Deltaproteobacteria bacterium]|nr:MAG: 4Fe-4S ferredoxin [Deltaproteobacteria bacterium]
MNQAVVNSEDIFHLLQRHLDSLPAGFPATESGIELRILRKLFTVAEAEIAVALQMRPEPVSKISQRLAMGPVELAPKLLEMSKKGLIFRLDKGDLTLYMAAQFVVGIWEYHVNDLDEELIRDVNEYLPQLMGKSWSQIDTMQLRVIPVAESLDSETSIMPYEAAEQIITEQTAIVVAPCICRTEQKMVGAGCDAPMDTCLIFGSASTFYKDNGLGREVSQSEALELLQAGLDAGLVLQPSNSQKPINICMCCGCCCQVLKNLKKMPHPAQMISANYYAEVNTDNCVACGDCAERCHMEAITVEGAAVVDLNLCIGCGVCVPACDYEALSIKQKDPEAQTLPPETMVKTLMQMAHERSQI